MTDTHCDIFHGLILLKSIPFVLHCHMCHIWNFQEKNNGALKYELRETEKIASCTLITGSKPRVV